MHRNIVLIVRYRAMKLVLVSVLAFAILYIFFSFSEPFSFSVFGPLKKRVIVLDPGHGGIDGGANCPGFLEKDTNLTIALKIKTELQKSGAKVILTRDRDIDLHNFVEHTSTRHHRDLLARIDIINKSKPDLFLSIHVNANPRRPSTTGPMVFYNQSVPASNHLADTIQTHLNRTATEYGFKKHVARPGEYFLLNNCPYPGTIVELGFMTNYKEKQMLQDSNYQQHLAKSISESIRQYFATEPQTRQDKISRFIVSDANKQKSYQVYFPQKESDALASEPLVIYRSTITDSNMIVNNIRIAVQTLIAGPRSQQLEPVLNFKTKILGVKVTNGIAVLDLSKEITSIGSYQEFYAVSALVETVCQFPGVNGLKILIDGQTSPTLGQHLDVSKVLIPEKPKIMVAIVIDDLAGDNRGLQELLDIKKPLTMAVMPKRKITHETAQLVHQKGYPVFLHLPMEPERGKASWLGEGAITAAMTPAEVAKQVKEDLADVPYVIGMNNHMGSKVTKRKDLMLEVLKIARSEHLIVLDSRTTEDTVIPDLAKQLHIPLLERSVFLDEINSVSHVKTQIRKLAELAKEKGSAVAIGHVGITGKNTARALSEMIPWLEEQGIELVFADQLLSK